MVIVDAGEGTIDVSAYSRNTKEGKDSFEEIAAPQCKSTTIHLFRHFHLSFILQVISMGLSSSASAPAFSSTVCSLLDFAILELTSPSELLADSPFIEDLDHIIGCFDKTTKLRFRNIDEPQYIKFGSTRDNDETYGIRFGKLKLQGCVFVVRLICYSC